MTSRLPPPPPVPAEAQECMATVPPPEVTGEILAELAALRAGLALHDGRLPCPCGCGALYGDECYDEPRDCGWEAF